MAYQPTCETDDSAVPAAVRIFFMRRLSELAGVLLFLVLIAAGLSLASWSVDDPSLNHALDRAAMNWLGLARRTCFPSREWNAIIGKNAEGKGEFEVSAKSTRLKKATVTG